MFNTLVHNDNKKKHWSHMEHAKNLAHDLKSCYYKGEESSIHSSFPYMKWVSE